MMLLQLSEADSVSQCAFGPNGVIVTSATGTLQTARCDWEEWTT